VSREHLPWAELRQDREGQAAGCPRRSTRGGARARAPVRRQPRTRRSVASTQAPYNPLSWSLTSAVFAAGMASVTSGRASPPTLARCAPSSLVRYVRALVDRLGGSHRAPYLPASSRGCSPLVAVDEQAHDATCRPCGGRLPPTRHAIPTQRGARPGPTLFPQVSEVLVDLAGGCGAVESVEVDARGAAGEEFAAEVGRDLNADCMDGGGILFDHVEAGGEVRGGKAAPDSCANRWIWCTFVTGITPGTIGT
jgi:hypothetical protein